MHGSPDSISVIVSKNWKDKEIVLDHRRLAKFLKSDKGYGGGNISFTANELEHYKGVIYRRQD